MRKDDILLSIRTLWNAKICEKYNSICIGKILRSCDWTLAVGCEDGVVRLYPLPAAGQDSASLDTQNCQKLETKGGPIQSLLLEDITQMSSCDMVVCDSRGMLTLFSNQQILKRKSVSTYSINCLLVDKSLTGSIVVVSSDSQGQIFAMSAYTDLWKLRLTDLRQLKGVSSTPVVKSMLTVSLPNPHGQTTNYILASDNWSHLYLIHQGSVVMVLDTPAVITAMCCGSFVNSANLEDNQPQDGNNPVNKSSSVTRHQVALGSENGSIYIMDNYQIYYDEFANMNLAITHMRTLPSSDPSETDTILCAGHFNALYMLKNGKLVGQHSTPDWINSMVTADIDNDGAAEVVFSCLDSSIHALKLSTPALTC